MANHEKMKEQITKAVKKHFKPEFVNRLDDLVIFKTLEKNVLKGVVELEINKLQLRLASRDIHIVLDEKAKNFLVDKGYQPEMGARPLRRVVEQHLEDTLSEELLREPNGCKYFNISLASDRLSFQRDTEREAKEEKDKIAAKSS
ncbi:hypothetical protein AB751O23_BN_00040 [Chlamydiales bacterium SCGC AB-751-O23]|nr:hypothetical protein AB751O23_BN_00040 [Chlamydiales bacterium SCGC AB-751-O23]